METRAKLRSNQNSFGYPKDTPINQRPTRALNSALCFRNDLNVTQFYWISFIIFITVEYECN